jgi:hypothetical protein
LKPILSPKSITLQLYEYGLMLREFWPQGFIVIPSWWRFTTQVFLEAMRCPEYKDEILRDLGGLAREAFPPLMGIAARLLIPLATFSPLTRIAAGLVEKRQKQQVASWETLGAARGIENVYAAAKYVHEATRSGAMVHQTECLPVA